MSILRNKMHALHEAQQRFTVMKRNVIEEKNFESYSPPVVLKQFRAPKQKVFILLYVWQIYYSDPSPRSFHLPLEYGSRYKLSMP